MLHLPGLTSQGWIFTCFVSRWDSKSVQKSCQKYFLLYFSYSSSFHSSPSIWDMFGVGNLCSDKTLKGEERGRAITLFYPHCENACLIPGVLLCSEWWFPPGLGWTGIKLCCGESRDWSLRSNFVLSFTTINELCPHKSWIAVKERFSPNKASINPINSSQ